MDQSSKVSDWFVRQLSLSGGTNLVGHNETRGSITLVCTKGGDDEFLPKVRTTGTNRKTLIGMAAIAFIIALSSVLVNVREAPAIPAFARKYGFDCGVCHSQSRPADDSTASIQGDH